MAGEQLKSPGRPLRVLLVDDDEDDYVLTRELLLEIDPSGYAIDWVDTYERALEELDLRRHEVYLVDYRLGGHDGLELLGEAAARGVRAPFILLTGQGDYTVDLQAMRSGAADYLVKRQLGAPLLERSIRHAVERAGHLEALRESERFLQSALDALTSRVAILDHAGSMVATNAAWNRGPGDGHLFGPELGVGAATSYLAACEGAPGECAESGRRLARTIRGVMSRQAEASSLEICCRASEEPRWFLLRVSRFPGAGPVRVVVAFEDISGIKEAEAALRRSEEQLRQAQKMEAIGRLAGGVAHDFNNMLTAIAGYSGLALERLHDADPIRPYIEGIGSATDRAAALTRQLLTFSRRQRVQAQVLSLDHVVQDMDGMLRRLIGEHVELKTACGAEIGFVRADTGQIEQVLMNLVVNARDAMPRGGRILIETAIVTLEEAGMAGHVGEGRPGPHVLLSVKDGGVGMDEEIRSRIFEPFFTTKSVGEGTGLGLATVYGIVKQAGGSIQVDSEPGRGSTFRVFLPRVAPDARETVATAVHAAGGGSETLLVVEDDELLRPIIRHVLEERGSRVMEAASPRAAVEVAERHRGAIDLMVTDVVMPEMNGAELLCRIAPLHPGMKVLFISGYTDPSLLPGSLLESGGAYLAKPFTPGALVQAVRESLDQPQPTSELRVPVPAGP